MVEPSLSDRESFPTSTTIITFLMVFLTKGAHTVLLDLEKLDEKHLDELKDCYGAIAKNSRAAMKKGKDDTGTPYVHLETA